MLKRKNSNLKRRSQRGRNSYARRSSINDLMLEMFKNDLVDDENDIEVDDTNLYNIVDKHSLDNNSNYEDSKVEINSNNIDDVIEDSDFINDNINDIIKNSDIFGDISINDLDNLPNESSDNDVNVNNTVSASLEETLEESLEEDVEIDNNDSSSSDNLSDENISLNDETSYSTDDSPIKIEVNDKEAIDTKEFIENYVKLFNETHAAKNNSSDEKNEEFVEKTEKAEDNTESAEKFLDEYIKSINKNPFVNVSSKEEEAEEEKTEKFLDDNTEKIEAYINSYIQKNMVANKEIINNSSFNTHEAMTSNTITESDEPIIKEINRGSSYSSINNNHDREYEAYQKQLIRQMVATNLKEPEPPVSTDSLNTKKGSTYVDEKIADEEPEECLYNEYYEENIDDATNNNVVKTDENTNYETDYDTNDSEEYNDDDTTVFEGNNILLISERERKVFLPYTQEDINLYLRTFPEKYSSPEDVIKNEFILPMSYFEGMFPSLIRFREAYAFYRDRGGRTTIESIVLAFKLMNRPELHPAIIAACRNEKVLKNFLNKLDNDDLEHFKDFEIYFKINPMVRV